MNIQINLYTFYINFLSRFFFDLINCCSQNNCAWMSWMQPQYSISQRILSTRKKRVGSFNCSLINCFHFNLAHFRALALNDLMPSMWDSTKKNWPRLRKYTPEPYIALHSPIRPTRVVRGCHQSQSDRATLQNCTIRNHFSSHTTVCSVYILYYIYIYVCVSLCVWLW